MHPDIKKFIKEWLPENQPRSYKAFYPKRIMTPGGYISPKYYAATLFSQITSGFDPKLTSLSTTTGLVNSLIQLSYGVPTYFVRSEFAQAAAHTEPPADFRLSEIKWPMPAMLFALPLDFSLKYFGHICPFISVARAEPGVYPDILTNLPEAELPFRTLSGVNNADRRATFVYPVYSNHTMPVDYTGNYRLDQNLAEIANAPFDQTGYLEECERLNEISGENVCDTAPDLPQGDAEQVFINKIQSFAIKLMMIVTARPTLIQVGASARKEKIKKNRLKNEIWHPNLIGWEYRAVRSVPTGEPGSHASPRMHWRKGHSRNQPHGPKPWTELSPKNLIWLEPVLVNAPAKPEE